MNILGKCWGELPRFDRRMAVGLNFGILCITEVIVAGGIVSSWSGFLFSQIFIVLMTWGWHRFICWMAYEELEVSRSTYMALNRMFEHDEEERDLNRRKVEALERLAQ